MTFAPQVKQHSEFFLDLTEAKQWKIYLYLRNSSFAKISNFQDAAVSLWYLTSATCIQRAITFLDNICFDKNSLSFYYKYLKNSNWNKQHQPQQHKNHPR